MYVGIGRLELRVPASGSLKSKRHVVKGLIGGLQSKFKVAAAEVDHQDLWQRTTLGISCVSGTAFQVRKVLHEIERWVSTDDRVEILDHFTQVVGPDDD
ncbi:MAG TPA: DUF503 domain-containing protein [Actinomycetota bacterium]|nr:DUF503 domain-containing protein [Actinomycetota bacterium]